MTSSMPAEQQKSIKVAKEKIVAHLSMGKYVPIPKSEFVAEAYKIAFNQLLVESNPADKTFYALLKKNKNRFDGHTD